MKTRRRSSRDFGPDWPKDFGAPAAVRLPWRYDDGGRRAAGFPRHADCGVRAGAIATGMPYREVYRELVNLIEPRPEWTGTPFEAMDAFLAAHGLVWTPTECTRLRADELPEASPLVVYVFRHFTVVVDGVIRDTGDPSRGGVTSVRGYWRRRPD